MSQFLQIGYCKNKDLFCIKPSMEELKTFFRKYEHLKEEVGFSRCQFFEVKTCTLVSVLENLFLLC